MTFPELYLGSKKKKNKLKNIREELILNNDYIVKDYSFFKKIKLIIKDIIFNKYYNLNYLSFYLFFNIKKYKQIYCVTVLKDDKSGVNLFKFLDFYDYNIEDIKKILNKDFLYPSEIERLIKLSTEKKVIDYYNIIYNYKYHKLINGQIDFNIRVKKDNGKELIFKNRIKNKREIKKIIKKENKIKIISI